MDLYGIQDSMNIFLDVCVQFLLTSAQQLNNRCVLGACCEKILSEIFSTGAF